MKADFGGYLTRYDVLCTDNRVIRKGAFDNCNQKLPLMWQHSHDSPSEVLGHVIVEHRDDGLYGYGYFNETPAGMDAKQSVLHGDIDQMSICANRIRQQGNNVVSGNPFEVSLVLSGANPGAYIDTINVMHGDQVTPTGDVVIYSGERFDPEVGEPGEDVVHADGSKTIGDILRTLNPEQKEAVQGLLGMALSGGEDLEQSDDMEEYGMDFNAFDPTEQNGGFVLSHAQATEIVQDAVECGSLRDSILAHAADYGIENIELLFPEAKNLDSTPQWIKRETGWVSGVMNGVHKSPFSRIKNMFADITADEARAKGYVKGNRKKDEVFRLLTRSTTPKTIYKRQKFDRDDLIDATELNIVPWVKAEMRMMLEEEIARAIMIGDGRSVDDEDKIDEDHIRPILKEDPLYVHRILLPADFKNEDLVETVLRNRKEYKGSGNPKLYSHDEAILDALLIKDTTGRRIYNTEQELASAMRVSGIETIPLFEGVTVTVTPQEAAEAGVKAVGDKEYELIGIIVNLNDYTVGADRGGQVSMFDDFDIDYNQYKYLIETRISGALTRYKSAMIILREKATASAARFGD